MRTIDVQVHAYEHNHPGRPWAAQLHGPQSANGEEMVAAMDEVGVDAAMIVSTFNLYRFDPSYALSVYERFLRETFVTAAMQAGRGVPQAIENRRLFTEYPGAVARLLEGFFAVDDDSQATLLRTSLRGARREFL